MNRSFEGNKLIYISLFFIIFLFFCSLNILFRKNIFLYKSFSGTYNNKYIGVFVRKRELEFFYRNSFVFIDGEKVKYEIFSIDNDILKGYSYVLFSVDCDFSEGEIIIFSILEKKIFNYKIFDVIWR